MVPFWPSSTPGMYTDLSRFHALKVIAPHMLPEANDSVPEERPRSSVTSGHGPSVGLIVTLVSSGMILGLLLAWFSTQSPWLPAWGRAPLYDEALIVALVERASPAIVEVTVHQRRSVESGSGFLVDDNGHIVTNQHVVASPGELTVLLNDGRTLDATLLGTSRADDLAVLKVDPKEVADITPLLLADSDEISPGQLAVAIGSAFSQFNSVTVGVVSGVNRSQTAQLDQGPSGTISRPLPELVQTDAALNPGNSGGPLLDRDGRVIGVNSAVQLVGNSFDVSIQNGVGFAVSSNTLRDILPDLLSLGEFLRPWLGVMSIPLSRAQFRSLGVDVEHGVYITFVCEDSPADVAGLRGDQFTLRPSGGGDLITTIDGNPVGDVSDIVSHLNDLKPGDTVTLSVIREKQQRDVNVTLAPWGNCAR
jgi:S1-C subfamily serine protease